MLLSIDPAPLLATHLNSSLSSCVTRLIVNTPVISSTLKRSLAMPKFCWDEALIQEKVGLGFPLAEQVMLADSPSITSIPVGISSSKVGGVCTCQQGISFLISYRMKIVNECRTRFHQTNEST